MGNGPRPFGIHPIPVAAATAPKRQCPAADPCTGAMDAVEQATDRLDKARMPEGRTTQRSPLGAQHAQKRLQKAGRTLAKVTGRAHAVIDAKPVEAAALTCGFLSARRCGTTRGRDLGQQLPQCDAMTLLAGPTAAIDSLYRSTKRQ